MKLDDSSNATMTPTNQSPSPHVPRQPTTQLNNKGMRQTPSFSTTQRRSQILTYQRRQNLSTIMSDPLNQHAPSMVSVPLLASAMNDFFLATKIMEDEVMLPSRLKDMSVDEVILDSSVQPDNWHEFYTFVKDLRDQLTRSRPFVETDNQSTGLEVKESTDDEGILIVNHENIPHSLSSSTVSSDELEQSSTSSNVTSFDTIKDELKYHYFGLLGTLDNLTNMANKVTDKYRDDSTFKH